MGHLSRNALALAAGVLIASYVGPASAGQTCTSGPFVAGVDVYDGTGSIDWTSAASAGIKFAIIKASQGTYDTDSEFAKNWANTKAAGIIRAPYHFLDPTESGVTQANFFLGIVGTLEAGDMPPVLDIECPTSNDEPDSDNCLGIGSSGDATGAQITQVMNDWLSTIKSKTGRTAIVYSYGSYFSDLGIDTTGLQNYPLYIAYPTTSDCFDFPGPWTAATFWQYNQNGTVAGIGSGQDLDYFLGNAAELSAFIANGTSPIPDAGVAPTPDAGEDAGVTCTVSETGDMGVCITTTACASMPNHVSTPDFCPGPADIQCCTSTAAPDAGVDATTGTGPGSGTGGGTGPGSGSGSGSGPGSGSGTRGATLDGGPGGSPPREGGADGDIGDDGIAPSTGGCTTSSRAAGCETELMLLVLGAVILRRRRSRSPDRSLTRFRVR